MRIAIAGPTGRMGRMLIEAVLDSPDLTLTVALTRRGSANVGQDAGAFLGRDTGVILTDDLDALKDADCLIDFTLPQAIESHLEACVRHNVKCVIGTTGFSPEQKQAIH